MSDKTTISPASAGHSLSANAEISAHKSKHEQEIITMNPDIAIRNDSVINGTNNSTKESASANTSGIIPGIEQADPDLPQDAQTLTEKERERQAETSRENGNKGGRPPINREELAQACIELVFAHHGQLILWRYRGGWHLYSNGKYKLTNEEEIEKKVTGVLTQVAELKGGVTTSLVHDVMTIMKAVGYCGLSESTHKMPCFISTGADASSFLPMKNGILDVEATIGAMISGAPLPQLRPITPDLFIDHGFDYDYDPMATCPRFMAYLEKVQPNPENRAMLQMLAGLLLLPDTSYNVAFFLYGQGGTGKTVFINVLEALLGKDNCCCVPLANFAARFDKVHLTEKLANLVGDMPIMPESGRIADMEGLFKSVTSGDEISVERKFVDSRTARVTARCVFATNEMPHFSDRSNGIWDRLRIIKFNVVVRNTEEQDPRLIDKLMEERPGILNWALQGLAELRTYKVFPQSEEGCLAIEELRAESDHEATFLRETVQADPNGFETFTRLYSAYRQWCQDNGFNSPVSSSKFKNAILRVFPGVECTRKRAELGRRVSVIVGISYI